MPNSANDRLQLIVLRGENARLQKELDKRGAAAMPRKPSHLTRENDRLHTELTACKRELERYKTHEIDKQEADCLRDELRKQTLRTKRLENRLRKEQGRAKPKNPGTLPQMAHLARQISQQNPKTKLDIIKYFLQQLEATTPNNDYLNILAHLERSIHRRTETGKW